MTEQQINQLAQSIARRWADNCALSMNGTGWALVTRASVLEEHLGLPRESLRFEGGDVEPIAADRVLYLYRPFNPNTDVTVVGRGLQHTLMHVFENIARCLIEDGGVPHFPDNPALTGELVKNGGTEAAAVKPEAWEQPVSPTERVHPGRQCGKTAEQEVSVIEKVYHLTMVQNVQQRLANLDRKFKRRSFPEALQEVSGVPLIVSVVSLEGQRTIRVLRVATTYYKLGTTGDPYFDIIERLAVWMVRNGRSLPASLPEDDQPPVLQIDYGDPKEEGGIPFSLGYRAVMEQKMSISAAITTSKDQEMMQRDTAGAYAAEVSKKAAQELAAQKKPEPKPSPFTTVAPMNGRLGNPHVKWDC